MLCLVLQLQMTDMNSLALPLLLVVVGGGGVLLSSTFQCYHEWAESQAMNYGLC